MEKNSFLIYNDILYSLYSCKTADELTEQFLPRLKMLIPYSYASILPANTDSHSSKIYSDSPLCVPAYFKEAELEYIRHADEDPLLWITQGRELTLIRESDLMQDESRINTTLYLHCYQKYNIFDTLQLAIIYQQKFLGVLTLFRTRIDGVFSDEDMFYLRSLGTHLCLMLHNITQDPAGSTENRMVELASRFNLTSREQDIIRLLFSYKNNDEIAEILKIRENTVQKHMQNIFRKLNISSKWELLRFR